jgi:diguanylate cyclase (GGDEF)-like protein/PAS domain S-box-containing protein
MTGEVRPRRRRPAATAAPLHELDLPSGEVVEIILRNLADAVFATDLDNHITYWAPSAERLFGYRASEAVGRSFGDLLPFRIAEGSDEGELLRTIAAGQLWRGQGTVTLRDGSQRWIESTVNPLLVEGRAIGSVSVSRDMTSAVAAANRRTAEQNLVTRVLEGLDAVGQVLAQAGPTPEALASVLSRLAGLMGYPYLSLYLGDAGGLRLGGQVGYERLPDHIDPGVGVIGRVLRSGEAAFVPDVSSDAEYRAGNPDVTSEIAVPLRGGGDLLGVLNVESTGDAPLTADDVHLINTVADRLASALLLGREQQELRDRTRLFAAVTVFGGVANAILDPQRLAAALADAVGAVVPSDTLVITTLDRTDGRYRVRAVRGVDEEVVGTVIEPGDGSTGRAIAERVVVAAKHHGRSDYATALRPHVPYDSLYGVAVPPVREGTVLGVISLGRAGEDATFSDAELEVIGLLGSQTALALANAYLMEEVSALAIHDGLTGLYNRRHFDAALELILARWRRTRSDPTMLAAIMFDLDHFGRFNQDHGHQAGDAVLRSFRQILRARCRASDLVARYGGEEFVAILEGCSLADAVVLADAIRLELDGRVIDGPEGQPLHARVSAGCAVLDAEKPTAEALLQVADVGLFMAKRAGRNRVVAA